MFPTHFVFNHFPKAGGTSFLAVCKYNIPERDIGPQLMEEDIRLLRPEQFEHYRLIRGHFSVLTQMGFSRHRYSMTLVRDPIQTILSTYNFWRTRPESDAVTGQAKSTSFAEFVRRFAASPSIVHNPYTHHFAAVSRAYPEEPKGEELLSAAKHNLAAFDFVGICEQFEDSVHLLCREVGWQLPPEIPHENRSGHAQLPESLDDETEQMLRQCNRLDLQLYDYAAGLFRARCEAVRGEQAGGGGPQALPACAMNLGAVPTRNRFVAFPLPQSPRRRASIGQVTAVQGEGTGFTGVTVTYAIAEPIPEVIVGVVIHDAEGRVACGPLTKVDKLPLEPRGERQVTFHVARDFAPQTYSVTAALESVDRPGVRYDWIDRATTFYVAAPPKLESWSKRVATRLAKVIVGPFSRPVWARLQAHLQPVEEKLGLLERATAGVRDRVIELSDAVARLTEPQRELRQELGHPNRPQAGERVRVGEAAEGSEQARTNSDAASS